MDDIKDALQWCRDINGCNLSDSWIERFIFSCLGGPPSVAPPLNGWCDFSAFWEIWSCGASGDQIRAGIGRIVSEVFRIYGYDADTNSPITTKEALRGRISAQLDIVNLDNSFRDYCTESIYHTIVNISADLCDAATLWSLDIYDIFDTRGFDSALLHSIFGTTPADNEHTAGNVVPPSNDKGNKLPVAVRVAVLENLLCRLGVTVKSQDTPMGTHDKTIVCKFINAITGGNIDTKAANSGTYRYIGRRLTKKKHREMRDELLKLLNITK